MLLAPFAAHAGNLSLVFTPANQTVAPSGTVTFSGIITNTSTATVFVNNDSFNVDPLLSYDDTAFLSAGQFSLAPGASYPLSGSANLFDITLDSKATLGSTYTGTFTILGGADNAAQDTQSITNFSVTAAAVPETTTTLSFGLLLVSGGLLAVKMRKRSAVVQN